MKRELATLSRKRAMEAHNDGEHGAAVKALQYLEGRCRTANSSGNLDLEEAFAQATGPIENYLVNAGILESAV
jgi:hypothetical protein